MSALEIQSELDISSIIIQPYTSDKDNHSSGSDITTSLISGQVVDQEPGSYTCHCGKSYRMFKNYKSHYVKYKCQPQLVISSVSTAEVLDINLDDQQIEVGYNPILKSRRQLINMAAACGDGLSVQPIARISTDNSLVVAAEVLNDPKYSECANCGLRLLKKNMRRHQSNNCKTSKELQLKQQVDAARNILSEYNNILVNNGIIGSNNVINDNRQIFNVAINCITQEAKDHLTEEAKVEIVGRIFTAFDCLLDHIYKDDRNKNIYYLGNGKKEVKYISESGEVNVGDADNIIGNIAMSHLNYLDELIDTHRDAVPKPYQKTIDQLINYHSTEDCNPGYIKKTGQKIMSFRDYAKAQVKKYEQEYINKHSGGQMVPS